MRQTLLALLCIVASSLALSQDDDSYQDIGEYRIHHTVFNSSFLPNEAISGYGFVRGGDRAIVNIAVTEKDAGGMSRGLPVELKASVSNLMQQSEELSFVEVSEGDATYYLAQLKFADQEILNFTVHVLLPGERYSDTITFSKTLYRD